MHITITESAIYVGVLSHFKSKWNKDGSLVVWSQTPTHAVISTPRGVFFEAVSSDGRAVKSGGDGSLDFVEIGKVKITLKRKALPDPKLSRSEIEATRKVVRRTLIADRPYSLNLPEKLSEFSDWLNAKSAEIPADCRDSTRIEFTTTTEYGETYPELRIEYDQSETDDEVVRRVQIDRERSRIAEAGQRAEFKRLQKKFGRAPA